MYQTIEPTFDIKIGIRDGKIVMIDWSELAIQECFGYRTHKEVIKIVKNYLKEAIRFIK